MSVEHFTPATRTQLDGVVIGILLDVPEASRPVVAFPGCPLETGIAATTTTQLSREDIGTQVALMFVAGDPSQPLVIGRIQRLPPTPAPAAAPAEVMVASLDGERLEFSAEKEIVLRCGKASITLTREGKVIIRGAYLSSRSTGVNRIKGGSVQIN
ncbi:MAG: DUF6484 domain-containing protein [Pseudomonas sp.]